MTLACLAATGTARASTVLWLDEVPHGFIANAFGPPRARQSFGQMPLTIAGRRFERGLGMHAPARLELNLAGRAARFTAWVGVDQEVATGANSDRPRAGATVAFRVLADEREAFHSGWVHERSAARKVDVDVRGAQRLTLLVESAPDGSPNGNADWAEARLTLRAGAAEKGLAMTAYPRGIVMSHAGFLPGAAKGFLLYADRPRVFVVRDTRDGRAVFQGKTARRAGDWGAMQSGDFTGLRNEGVYYVECGAERSRPFPVRADLHRELLRKHLNWFLWQRCGDPEHGWERGQHADDGRRRDNGRHQDVRGGWHDAADLRKWGMTITGLWALSEWARMLEDPALRPRVLDEIRWGNRYFLAMQEPAGYMMSHVGGDVDRHGDNNRFTDNIPGTADDRVIVTDPAGAEIQFEFILAQANAARVFAREDAAFAGRCQEAAERAWRWAMEQKIARGPYPLGAAVTAAARLFALTGQETYRQDAARLLKDLLALQETQGKAAGFFYTDARRTEPAHMLHMGNLPLWGLCVFAETFPDASERAEALAALRRYADGWLAWGEARSTYGQVPYALYARDPGGGRRADRWFYRWCYVNNEDDAWWNGVNPHIASTGAALARMARLLGRPDLRRIAQRQLDFIYGANPFDASWVTGIGTNQPEYFKTSEFVPPTPLIAGAVMAGLGSSRADQPVLLPGWWQTTEYWMEAVAPTMLLLHALERAEGDAGG